MHSPPPAPPNALAATQKVGAKPARSALDKVRSALPRARQVELQKLCKALAFVGVPAHHPHPEVVTVIEEAFFEGLPLRIKYLKRPEFMPQWRRIRLRTLVMSRTNTLLNCDDLDKGEARQFVLHKIVAAEILSDSVTDPAGYGQSGV